MLGRWLPGRGLGCGAIGRAAPRVARMGAPNDYRNGATPTQRVPHVLLHASRPGMATWAATEREHENAIEDAKKAVAFVEGSVLGSLKRLEEVTANIKGSMNIQSVAIDANRKRVDRFAQLIDELKDTWNEQSKYMRQQSEILETQLPHLQAGLAKVAEREMQLGTSIPMLVQEYTLQFFADLKEALGIDDLKGLVHRVVQTGTELKSAVAPPSVPLLSKSSLKAARANAPAAPPVPPDEPWPEVVEAMELQRQIEQQINEHQILLGINQQHPGEAEGETEVDSENEPDAKPGAVVNINS